jgi:hypothetical protein
MSVGKHGWWIDAIFSNMAFTKESRKLFAINVTDYEIRGS